MSRYASRSTPINNTSGCKGVYWSEYKQKWVVARKVAGKQYSCGQYDFFEDAERKAREIYSLCEQDFLHLVSKRRKHVQRTR